MDVYLGKKGSGVVFCCLEKSYCFYY